MIALEVLASGPLATIQDLGRPGLAHLGVTGSGAADRRSHTLANRLVANPDAAATVEITLGGFAARIRGGDVDIAVTGAEGLARVDGIPFGHNSIARVRDGQLVSVDLPQVGLRSYLAVRGGIDVAPVLGSRSFDTLATLGPAPLKAGDRVAVGPPNAAFPTIEVAPLAPLGTGPVTLRVVRGPRQDWFVDPGALLCETWTVSERSDRIGVRLSGAPLTVRWPQRQLPSEGTLRGTIQVPPNGQPMILGPDHPVTGGYPVIAVVADADTDVVNQLRPGRRLRLVELKV